VEFCIKIVRKKLPPLPSCLCVCCCCSSFISLVPVPMPLLARAATGLVATELQQALLNLGTLNQVRQQFIDHAIHWPTAFRCRRPADGCWWLCGWASSSSRSLRPHSRPMCPQSCMRRPVQFVSIKVIKHQTLIDIFKF
jgi:hypothetical protein